MNKKGIVKLILEKLNKENDLKWSEISSQSGLDFSSDHVRKMAYGIKLYDEMVKENEIADIKEDKIKEYKETLLELKKKRNQLSDERTYTNKKIRALSRIEDFIDTMKDELELLAYEKPLTLDKEIHNETGENAGVLLLSDIHYGIEINNPINTYNPELTEYRINKLINKTIEYCKLHNVKELYVYELGDTISGLIHNNLRLENRYGATQQIVGIANIISEALFKLASELDIVHFSMVEGNHDRVIAKKDDNLNEDSFTVLTQELIFQMTKNIKNLLFERQLGSTYALFNIKGHKCFGVHGDKDKPVTVCEGLKAITGIDPDYIFMGHYHHANEYSINQTEVIINGSLSGVDEYAYNLRKNSPAVQKFIVINNEGRLCTYNIKLN